MKSEQKQNPDMETEQTMKADPAPEAGAASEQKAAPAAEPLAEQPNYENWVPGSLLKGSAAAAGGLGALSAALCHMGTKRESTPLQIAGAVTGAGAVLAGCVFGWSVYAHHMFSYDGDRKVSKSIVEGTASYITLPEGGVGLDVGCGSGALTIACAKRNPQGRMVGIDRWGKEYSEFSQALCERNAAAEGVDNVTFQKGDATHLDFDDETFDAVTSNYVYHNILGWHGWERQDLLTETLRVLKKGGVFAIHDIFTPIRYGDMNDFVERLRSMGYEDVRLIDTTKGLFLSSQEAASLGCRGSALLVGRK